LAQFRSPESLGFVGSAGDLNRFRSRYRFAKSFRELSLDGYRPETAAAYSATARLFFVWSAFESFMEICGLTIEGMGEHLEAYDPAVVGAKISALPGSREYLSFVLDRLTSPKPREHLAAFLGGDPCNLLFVPAGIRHIFAHGDLTPHAGGVNPYVAQEMANLLSEFIFKVMDGEFTRRLREHGVAA